MINGLPKKLHELRLKYGYSQKQVADRLAVSPSIISGYETGERTPSIQVLLSLSNIYHCSTDYLLGKESERSPMTVDVFGLTEKQIIAIQNLIDTIKDTADK